MKMHEDETEEELATSCLDDPAPMINADAKNQMEAQARPFLLGQI